MGGPVFEYEPNQTITVTVQHRFGDTRDTSEFQDWATAILWAITFKAKNPTAPIVTIQFNGWNLPITDWMCDYVNA